MKKEIEGYYCEDTWDNEYEVLSYGFISKEDYNKHPDKDSNRFTIFYETKKINGKWINN